MSAALLLTLGGCSDEPAPASEALQETLSAELISLNNLGVGEMGRFDYGAAVARFEQVVAQRPDWEIGQLNLAIAILNRQQVGDEQQALQLLTRLLLANPQLWSAHYLAGILQFNSGQIEAAIGHFRAVTAADPGDAHAAYFAAQCLLQMGQFEPALKLFERSLTVDPYLRSAYYGAFLASQRLGDSATAREMLEIYQRLENNPRSYLAEIKYTRMGPRASAVPVRERVQSVAPVVRPDGPLFADVVSLPGTGDPTHSKSAAAWQSSDGTMHLLLHGDRGLSGLKMSGVADATQWQHPFAGSASVNAAAWGDYDNDGRVDLYLAGGGDNFLWQQTGEQTWQTVAQANDVGNSVDAIFFDADHDGDLDLFVVNSDAPNELFNNNLDGTFRRLAAEHGLAGPSADGAQVLAADFDSDRDTDLLVLNREAPHEVYINDRLWRYHPGQGFDAIVSTPLKAIAFADMDVDGAIELYGLNESGELLAWRRGDEGVWQEFSRHATGNSSWDRIEIQDFDADGPPEVLLSGPQGWQLLRLSAQPEVLWQEQEGPVLAVLNLQVGSGPGILDRHADGLNFHPAGPGRHRFLSLNFSGAEDGAQSMRSNRSGIGTRFVLRSGSDWSAGSTLRNGSGPGQSLQAVALGTAGHPFGDYLEVDWSDGVFQTELALEVNQTHQIVETQRQLASCPVLFAHDGENFRFVSDVLGVGGIGFAIGPGEYATPRPVERFRLPFSSLKSSNGQLRLKLTEPMEEIAYIDSVTLTAMDYPEEFDMVLDERMATGAAEPSGEPLWYRELIRPVRATDAEGKDRLDEIDRLDRVAAPPGRADPRFVGLLESEHVLELEFDRDLSRLEAPVMLLHGWVEYGYSQTNFAAWQAGRVYQPPTLEAASEADDWSVVAREFGYPAGMPREASLPLAELPAGTTRLRLRTTQQIYWDQLALVETVTSAQPVVTRLPISSARVQRIGFPKRSNGPQLQPSYDFQQRSAFWDTRYPSGFYTAFGPATELVTMNDNALAIIGPGDALELEFSADAPPLAPGWQRSWILEFNGWAKDMDLYTRDGETVLPLPSQKRDIDQSSKLHPVYNTRFQSGH